jgi:hypothetical protein
VNRDAVYAVLPFLVIAALGAGFWLVFRERAAARREALDRRIAEPDLATTPFAARRSTRPWWGSPWLWLAVCVVFLALGLLVWPGLFGGTVIFLPFVWVFRPRRVPAMDPRGNGHRQHGDSGALHG